MSFVLHTNRIVTRKQNPSDFVVMLPYYFGGFKLAGKRVDGCGDLVKFRVYFFPF